METAVDHIIYVYFVNWSIFLTSLCSLFFSGTIFYWVCDRLIFSRRSLWKICIGRRNNLWKRYTLENVICECHINLFQTLRQSFFTKNTPSNKEIHRHHHRATLRRFIRQTALLTCPLVGIRIDRKSDSLIPVPEWSSTKIVNLSPVCLVIIVQFSIVGIYLISTAINIPNQCL